MMMMLKIHRNSDSDKAKKKKKKKKQGGSDRQHRLWAGLHALRCCFRQRCSHHVYTYGGCLVPSTCSGRGGHQWFILIKTNRNSDR